MFSFSITAKAITASFRVPETHTFHQTLPLPPKTTIIGMIGAALGLRLDEAHAFVDTNNILVSVYGTHEGIMKDLWNYRKLTGKEKSYTLDDIKNRRQYSILIREFLYSNDFTFFFAAEKTEPLDMLKNAFSSPHYALTAGNSDDLLKICSISDIQSLKPEKINRFRNTFVPGDMSRFYKHDIDLKQVPITQTLFTPQVFLLPTKFEFKGEERRVIERKPFTFISTPVTFSLPLDGYCIDGKAVVLQ
ncbi:MAG: CRISPR-associated protein Cas5 [Methanoregula sp.]|jgi:CRISPR-associated protein Cas5t|uniref:CRISPR-associated protein Cas5 n=1 Tax=Methanoregula sp. TaxID=2052170 RepID=UPI003D0DF811